ncbi:GTP-binding protein [Velocimicrobium porci]|uniref:Cobalamin biosynthesis protein P47K n=1 Tax=Velocimicrobium porci TaxID=2606634 RepID=A0A6L5XZJ9_9FIRM|nr:GTP-binding protein [Velocimicrobium porci]MSS64144.1 cobalamin biosynthesis protein P47K [Velocimicrobium porci]
MPDKIILLSGASAVGKTAVLKLLVPLLKSKSVVPAVCKIDCIHTEDDRTYEKLGVKYVIGLSGDICPDHFLVSNLPELWGWSNEQNADWLFIETAGLCHRCSPATQKMISGCILDCTSSCHAPSGFGPMLSQADFVVLTKIDMLSQAEREIIVWKIKELNSTAEIFMVDGLTGYGIEPLISWLLLQPNIKSFENDCLRHTMPSGVCSYCVGETRVGSDYQQGMVAKIQFKEERE